MSNPNLENASLAEAELSAFAFDNPADLSRELALIRYILAQSVREKNFGLSAGLLSTLGRLSREFERQQYRNNQMLARSAITKIGQELINIFVEEFCDCCPDYDERIDRVAERVTAVMSSKRIGNSKSECDKLDRL